MAIFKYRQTKVMEPRDGNAFSTTYYQQSAEEIARTYQHVLTVAREIVRCCENDPSLKEYVQSPLKGFRKLRADNYSLEDIVGDLLKQLDLGKDIPSGMLGRWNKIFQGTDWDIELVQEYSSVKVSPSLFNDLFAQR